MTDVISSFRGEHWFLSNFYPCAVPYESGTYPTVENAYHAAKVIKKERKVFATISPFYAKRSWRRLEKQYSASEWDEKKLTVMRKLLDHKFGLDKALVVGATFHHVTTELRAKLLLTGDAELIEGNTWGDRFWGAELNNEGWWEGENYLGEMLMQIRKSLRKKGG